MAVHLQAVRSWRENKIIRFSACNHSVDGHGFGCQQFTKAMVEAIKWLKSLHLLEWWWCWWRVERDPKANIILLPSSTVWKTKGWDLIQGQIRCVFVCVQAPMCVFNMFVATLSLSVHIFISICTAQKLRVGSIFYKELSCQEAIVCATRWQASRTGDEWCPADKKINKNAAIVLEAMSRISAGVWDQNVARNSLSIKKQICHIFFLLAKSSNSSFYMIK